MKLVQSQKDFSHVETFIMLVKNPRFAAKKWLRTGWDYTNHVRDVGCKNDI